MTPNHKQIPLSLYVHLPWCVRKCPYCDFNSHRAPANVPEQDYVDALLADLEQDTAWAGGRPIETMFIGGGTPSLFSPDSIDALLEGVRAQAVISDDAEITLEANPGTVDEVRFAGFRQAGVNRLSIGVQSFNDESLKALGRIHDSDAARRAMQVARDAGFTNVNLDLMFALPGQSEASALADVEEAVALEPEHISHYQLTLEPGTPFFHRPPTLPDHDDAWRMQRACGRVLRAEGYRQYEVSAWAKPGYRCCHNLNYWCFGDYLGIGAGAHSKVTLPDHRIVRFAKQRHPSFYQARAASDARVTETRYVTLEDRAFEFLLNALRLNHGVSTAAFEARTGLRLSVLAPSLKEARCRGLLQAKADQLRATALGRRFLDDLTAMFLPEAEPCSNHAA